MNLKVDLNFARMAAAKGTDADALLATMKSDADSSAWGGDTDASASPVKERISAFENASVKSVAGAAA